MSLSEIHPIELELNRGSSTLREALRRFDQDARVDLAGVSQGALALTLVRAARAKPQQRYVVVTEDNESARRMAADIRFFLGTFEEAQDIDSGLADSALLYTAPETSPFLAVAPDRRAAMERLAILYHVASSLPWRFFVTPAAALARRVPPRDALRRRSLRVEAESELDREQFISLLSEAGYLRVPVAEDPGTFAVRGALIDVFPAHAPYPSRIELDDWLVLSIKHFDPEDQRTIAEVNEVLVHPVREMLASPEELVSTKQRLRGLCDDINYPSTKARQLTEDIEQGRAFIGIEAYTPAFYEALETPFDYVGGQARVVVVDPTAVARAVAQELDRADRDRAARVAEGLPTFARDAHYLDLAGVAEELDARPLVVAHRVAVTGVSAEHEEPPSPLDFLETVSTSTTMSLGAQDHTALINELRQRRLAKQQSDALTPLTQRLLQWLESGVRVLLTTRTTTQAERLMAVLRGYEVPAGLCPAPFNEEGVLQVGSERAHVVIGQLGHGFIWPSEQVAFVTEEEIFGERKQSRRSSGRRERDKARAFLEDLRSLRVGDYVVHVDHGVGRYLGIERKAITRSQFERMQGAAPIEVEVLIVEYAGGDRFYLPVTRLNQLQKFSGKEGQKPRLDRLGGQTFQKTKARVARSVRQLADELLKVFAQRAQSSRPAIASGGRAYSEFEATFRFDETPDQARAIDEVLEDLSAGRPMDRVVCGDVGFGKTEVALRAAFRVAMSGKQVALLCPTTVLAQQHYHTVDERFRDYPLKLGLLSRFVDAREQTRVLAGLKDGTIDVVVGTHRLLSKDVHFKDLGLLVVDEEQRFGVAHKERIKKLRADVDVLTLSATPIPRTLQMAIGGVRDLSLITTPPVDRRAVRTFVTRWDDHVLREAIERELARGGQVFFVHNRIEGLYERAQRLQDLVPNARVVVGHGQMKESALEQVMGDFVEGRYDLLCSTAIIETGLDIPRANTILIDRADMFGLAQLYQLRGRVGRSRERAYCYLITPPPSKMTDESRYRIEALERFTELGSGFHIASLDMELRGAGDLLGAEQSGNVASVGLDLFVHMLEEAVAELKGMPVVHQVDPEVTLDVEHYLPEEYIDDVGVRLSLYKRFAGAEDEQEVQELAEEMEDRFGPPPPSAVAFAQAMALKPALRALCALGCEATRQRVTLHLRDDTPLDTDKVLEAVNRPRSPWKLTPDMKLFRAFGPEDGKTCLDHVRTVLKDVEAMKKVVAHDVG